MMNRAQRNHSRLNVSTLPIALFVAASAACFVSLDGSFSRTGHQGTTIDYAVRRTAFVPSPDDLVGDSSVTPRPIEPFMERGLKWLADAQHPDGGWGGGSHANQQIRDPQAVQTDPGTTAFTAMALLRAGNTTTRGEYHDNVRKALDYLLKVVEDYKGDRPTITDLTGTQPQVKLGQYVDVSLCSQFLSRILPFLKDDPAREKRTAEAIDKCLGKIQNSQKTDGSWNHGGWAPVLSTTMANSALENAQSAGRSVDDKVLQRSRDYQKGKYAGSGTSSTPTRVDGGDAPLSPDGGISLRGSRMASGAYAADGIGVSDAAGVALYSISSNQRANALEARTADMAVKKAQTEGRLSKSDTVSEDNLVKSGMKREEAKSVVTAYQQNRVASAALKDERTLSGFGNNGGEEFLSYMLASESLVLTGGSDWVTWTENMHSRLGKIQNGDGSWSGHHCITSPVFCTAAVILCLTADRDPYLKMADANKPAIK